MIAKTTPLKFVICNLLFVICLLIPLPSFAFDPDFIVSDQALEEYISMSAGDIRQFFLDRGSFLAYYADFWPENGVFMDAAEIIWRASQQFKINPKFLLVLLEKEQGLISIQRPSQKRLDWAMGYAACDKCWLKHPLVAKFQGFAKQIYFAADRIRNTYLADLEKYGVTHTGMGPGITKKIDKRIKVTPTNKATAILYTYTPHVTGNKNFFLIWNKWFSDLVYPDGSLLQNTKTGGIYLIQDGKKRPFLSKAAFVSRFNESQVIQVASGALDKYYDGPPIKFVDYSLLRDENQNLYMTVGDRIRPFESQEVFKSLGFSPFEVEDVTQNDFVGYETGSAITLASAYPTGSLLQNKETGGVYWVYNGIKYPIWDKSIITARFPKYTKIKVSEDELLKFTTGEPVKFADGTLLKSDGSSSVYIVSDGKLRPIPSEDIFLAYSWDWKDVITTVDKILGLYEIGAPITLNKQLKPDDVAPIIPEQDIQDEQNIMTN